MNDEIPRSRMEKRYHACRLIIYIYYNPFTLFTFNFPSFNYRPTFPFLPIQLIFLNADWYRNVDIVHGID